MNLRAICTGILLSALLYCSTSESFAQSAIAHAGQQLVNRIYRGFLQPSPDGSFDFTMMNIMKPSQVGYVNVVIDLNGNRTIEDYLIPAGGTQSEWVIQNVPIPVTDEIFSEPTISVWFDFSDMSIPIFTAKAYAMIITDQPVSLTLPTPIQDLSTWDQSTTEIIGADWGTIDSLGQGFVSLPTVSPTTVLVPPVVFENPGPRDSTGVPDIAQQTNECGPTSAANSLIWLAKKNKFMDKLPKKGDGSLDTNQLILDLMKAMTGSDNRPFGGLTGNQMLTGKQKYIQDKTLPLTVEGGNADTNAVGSKTYDFIVKQLDKGQDVELLVWWPDSGGHWVTVTGYAIVLGRAFIYVHDPDDKKTAKVIWEFGVDGTGNVTGNITAPKACTAAWAVAESPAPPGGVGELPDLPKGFTLYDNYPNPFNPSTTIEFALPYSAFVSIKIFNVLGEEVASILSREFPAGKHSAQWDAANMPSGVYFYRFSAGGFVATRRLLLLK